MFQVLLSNFLLVTAAKVTIDNFFRVDSKPGCNGTRRVQWQPIDTGNCLVEYTMEFRKSSEIVGTVENIRGPSYCTRDHDNATSVIIWATYEGRQGIKSDAKPLTLTQESTTPTGTTVSATSTQEGKNLSC